MQQKTIFDILEPGDLVFDVGAHIGNKSEKYLEHGARVVCFEPQPRCINELNKRFESSIADGTIIIEPVGLGDMAGKLTMSVCSESDTISTFSEAHKLGRFIDVIWDSTIQVSIDTLDHAIEKYGIPKFCKIDVEGFEMHVFNGLSKAIPYISFEFLREGQTEECLTYLEKLGYYCFNVAVSEDPKFLFNNWINRETLTKYLNELSNSDLMLWGDVYAKHAEPDTKDYFLPDYYQEHNKKRQGHLLSLNIDLNNKNVLEVGAGVGDHTKLFLDRDCKITVTDSRPELLNILQEKFAKNNNVTVNCINMENPEIVFSYKFDIVYCYGLLYHLKNPDIAIKYMADNCSDKLLLESCVSFGDHEDICLCEEDISNPTQSFSGSGCRPTRPWIFSELKKHFEYVYIPVTQPDHPEFPLNWNASGSTTSTLSRAVFIASRKIITNDLLTTELLMIQRI